MEVFVLDTNLQTVDIIDIFESLIWTDRYYEFGDFEIYTKASTEILGILQPGYYLISKKSDRIMIIEDRQLKNDSENGDYMVFSGRSFESVLTRRVVLGTTILNGNLQNGIEMLLNDNVINPESISRKIDNFVFVPSSDPMITSLTVDAQYSYDELYAVIAGLCSSNNIGFKIILSPDNKFMFQLYSGVDRSYNQIQNPYIVFSPDFDNLLNGNYSESNMNFKNVSIVAGAGEGEDRFVVSVGEESGLSRYEIYTDARDISKTVDDVILSDEEYAMRLARRGIEDLSDHVLDMAFDGQADTSQMFKYGEDFNLGDIVQFVSEYNIKTRAQITEIIMSQSPSSIDIYPTFTIFE